MDLGLPTPSSSAFGQDPEIKRECIWAGECCAGGAARRAARPARAQPRRQGVVQLTQALASFDSMMTHCADPRSSPEMLMLREQMRGWRFYDQFRADLEAPARQPQIGTTRRCSRTTAPTSPPRCRPSSRSAMRGARRFGRRRLSRRVGLGLAPRRALRGRDAPARPAAAAQSRRALRWHAALPLWIAALLTPRPPQLLVLNEPETEPATPSCCPRSAD
jgi:hypothetical protein